MNQFPLTESTKTEQKKRMSSSAILAWMKAFLPDLQLTNLSTDWRDGKALITLVDRLKPGFIRHRPFRNPTSNITQAMVVAEEHLDVPAYPSPSEMSASVPSEQVWSSYLSYYCSHDAPGHRHVVDWLTSVIPEMTIINFHSDWADGLALVALAESFLPHISRDRLSSGALEKMSANQRVRHAMDLSERLLGVEKILEPDEFLKKNVDPLMLMAYITQFMYANYKPQSVKASVEEVPVAPQEISKPSQVAEAKVSPVSSQSSSQDEPDEGGYVTPTSEPDAAPADPSAPDAAPDPRYNTEQYQAELENMSTEQLLAQLQTTADWSGPSPSSSTHSLPKLQPEKQEDKPKPPAVKEKPQRKKSPVPLPTAEPLQPTKRSTRTSEDLDAIFAAVESEIDFDSVFKELDEIGTLKRNTATTAKPVKVKEHASVVKEEKVEQTPSSFSSLPKHRTSPSASFHSRSPSPSGSPTSFPELCKASGRGLYCSAIHQLTQFTVDCSSAGQGRLEIIITNPNGFKVDASGEQLAESVFQLSFTPKIKGTHKIEALFNGRNVPDSPFECEVCDPSVCIARGEGLHATSVNVQTEFKVETNGAGPGSLSAIMKPSRTSKLRLVSRDGNCYTYSFVVEKPIEYRLELKWAGFPIPNSPFVIKVSDKQPAHCVLLEEPPRTLNIGQPLTVLLDTGGPWPEDLKVELIGQRGQELCNIRHEKKGHYAIISHPSTAGKFTLTILLKGKHIKGSPIEFEVEVPVDPSKCVLRLGDICQKVHNVDDKVKFGVWMGECGPGELTCQAKDPSGGKKDVSLTKRRGSYEVSYTPDTAGSHTVEVLFAGQPIPHSPVQILVQEEKAEEQIKDEVEEKVEEVKEVKEVAEVDDSVDGSVRLASKLFSEVVYPTGHQKVGEPVVLEASLGRAWSDDLKAFVTGPYRTNQACAVNEQHAGTYVLSFKPWKVGEHQLHVQKEDVDVEDFPYVFPVNDPSRCRVDCSQLATVVPVDQPIVLTVDATKCGDGEVAVTAKGPPNQMEEEVSLTQMHDDLWRVTYTPRLPGAHNIEVLFDDVCAPSCPIQVRVCNPSACMASGEGIHAAVVDAEAEFTVDVTNAGPGRLTANMSGPSEHNQLRLASRDGNTYMYNYLLCEPGEYQLDLQWAGYPILGSPFTVKAVTEEQQLSAPPPPSNTYVAPVPAVAALSCTPDPDQPSPVPCEVVSSPTGYQVVGEPVSIRVDIGGGWPDNVTVSVVREDGMEEPCRVKQLTDEMYSVSFTPRVIGSHLIHINQRGENIADSPILVKVCDPSKSVVDLTNITNRTHPISAPIPIKVDIQQCGQGLLTAQAREPRSRKHQELSIKQSDSLHLISYTPQVPGRHTLELFLEGIPLPSNPIFISVQEEPKKNVDDIQLVRSTPIKESHHLLNKTLEFQLVAKNRDQSLLEFKSVGMKTGNRPFTSLQPAVGEEGVYNLQFRATEPDKYRVFATYDGVQITGSPFTIAVSAPPQARNVTMFDPVIPLTVNNPLELMFDATHAGEGRLVAFAVNAEQKIVKVEVDEIEPKLYRVSLVPEKNDMFTVNVLWSDRHINGSPFKVAYEEQLKDPPITIIFEPNMVNKGLMGAAVFGNSVGRQDVLVQQYERGRYKIGFKPDQLDTYKLHVYWFDEEIAGSPFVIDLLSDDAETPQPNQLPISVGTNKGILTAEVVGRSFGPVPVKMDMIDDCICDIQFNTRIRDTFDLNLLWNDEKLSKSPISLRLY